MVLLDSHGISRVPRYLGILSRKICSFRLRDYHPLWFHFPVDSAINRFCNFPKRLQSPPIRPRNPNHATLAGYHTEWVWALPISLATTLGILLSSWGYLDVSVPPVPSNWPMCSASSDRVLLGRVSPFGYLRIYV